MQSLPDGVHYFTDGSKSESKVAAAYIVNDTASFLRLNDDATITQAELVAICVSSLQKGPHVAI